MSRLRAALVSTRLLGRDPVMTVSVVVSGLIALLPAFGWPTEILGAVTAALVALGGVVSAWLVAADRALPLLVGLGKAIIAAVAAFGVHLPGNQLVAVMAVLTFLGGLVTRPQVHAEQPARTRDGGVINPTGLSFELTTDYSGEDCVLPGQPLPPVPDRPQRGDDTVAWSMREPATEYLPSVGDDQVRQHRADEQTGRHHWRMRGQPDLGHLG